MTGRRAPGICWVETRDAANGPVRHPPALCSRVPSSPKGQQRQREWGLLSGAIPGRSDFLSQKPQLCGARHQRRALSGAFLSSFFKDCWPWKGDIGVTGRKQETAPALEKAGVGFSSAWCLDQPHEGRLRPEGTRPPQRGRVSGRSVGRGLSPWTFTAGAGYGEFLPEGSRARVVLPHNYCHLLPAASPSAHVNVSI